MTRAHILPDVLPDVIHQGLVTLFCGSAVGKESARRGAYYAHPGNRFWPTLHAVGLTDRLLRPEEFHLLPNYAIGLTDLAKHEFGNDDELSPHAYDVEGLRNRIRSARPKLVAFNGKRPASAFLGVRRLDYGEVGEFAGVRLFVLPATSGRAIRFWDISHWQVLGELHASLRDECPIRTPPPRVLGTV